MRPNQLVIEAFGPYAERAEVDFDALTDTRVFVVSGPTGAGKTSIFDAMCWALYGELPGNRFREGRVRSDAAAPDRLTSVTLTFTVDDTAYRVMRRPEQDRPKVRGTGITTEKQQVELHRRVGDKWEPVAHRWSETNRICTDLVGLTPAQFQQVVLLPQGRFQEVLHAGSDDRTTLLRTLFDTAGFERAQDLLDRRAKTAEARCDELVAEFARSEDTANAELDALECLVEGQGIELPPIAPPAQPSHVPEATAYPAAGPLPEIVPPPERNATHRSRHRGRGDLPGQLSLVPEVDVKTDIEAPPGSAVAPRATPAPVNVSVTSVSTAGRAVEAPAAPSLGDRAERLECHGVTRLERRRDAQRKTRVTAEAKLTGARQLAERQDRFRDDRTMLTARVGQLDDMEVNRVRLDAARRAAGIDDSHRAAQRATTRLAEATTTAGSAIALTANELAALVETWPTGPAANQSDEVLPDWLSDAVGLNLNGVPTPDSDQLAGRLEALAQRFDREAGDLRTRANEIAQAQALARQATTCEVEADAASAQTERLDEELAQLTIEQRWLETEREAAATFAADSGRAQAALTRATELYEAHVALTDERESLAEVDDELDAIIRQTNEVVAATSQLTAERDAAREVAGTLAERHSEAERAATNVRLVRKRDQTEAALTDATAAVQRGLADYNRVMAGFTAAAAPRLADTLIDDVDCPVCGSTEHPRPASAPDGAEPVSSADLERAHEANVAAIARCSTLRDRLDECRTDLGGAAAELLLTVEQRHRTAQALVEQARTAVTEATAIDQRLIELATQHQTLEQRNRTAHGRQAAGRQRIETLLERLADSANADAVDLHARVVTATFEAQRCDHAAAAVVDLDRRRTAVTEQVVAVTAQRAEAANQALASSTRAIHLQAQASAQLTLPDVQWPHADLGRRCENLAVSARGAATSLAALGTATHSAGEADTSLRTMLKRQGFDDLDGALAAQLDQSERNHLHAALSRWDREGFALTERLVSTVEGGLSLAAPNLEALTGRLVEATDAADRLTEHATTARNHLVRARRAMAELDGRGGDRAAAQADYETTHRLARMCRGHNAGRVTLEAWVLAHHLREVVTSANRRLGAMSRGRFQIHVDDEAADQRAKHGLDLSIADAETGTRRPVRTLSGGQTFQASLALALGLADTIAVQRVGRDIGATFIDEGFGGLDADSLDTAIEVLNNLGAEGQMIGVITHVEELKTVLPVAIEVTPLGGGRSELNQLIGGSTAAPSTSSRSTAVA